MGFSATGNRTFMGYWVPLAITVGVATISIAAWVWSEREEDDDEGEYGRNYPDDYPPPGPDGGPPPGADFARSAPSDARQDDNTVMGRMQGALRRTPSPQQLLDGASRRVAAGVAAAGAMVGGALSSIREERGDFEDHSRWSEEADSRARGATEPGPRGVAPSSNRKKTVALVVSADALSGESDDISLAEHAVCFPYALIIQGYLLTRFSQFSLISLHTSIRMLPASSFLSMPPA
jgi:hypothetical protein